MTKISKPTMRPLSKDFVQPEGHPDISTVNQRTMAAVSRLNVRGVTPQGDPAVTSWQLHALMRVLSRKGLIDQAAMDEITYFTVYLQMQDLERLVDEKPRTPLLVPRSTNGH